MSDDLDPRPHYPIDTEQTRLRLAWGLRKAAEEREIDRLTSELIESQGSVYGEIAWKQGLQHKDDQQQFVEAMARNAAINQARTTIRHETIDVTQLADDLIEQREIINQELDSQAEAQQQAEVAQREQAQRDREAITAAAAAEPIPGSVARFDAALAERAEQRHEQRLGQKERLNNADMDMLAARGPHRANYGLLRQPAEANQIAPAPAPAQPAEQVAPAMVNSATSSSGAFTIRQGPAVDQWLAMYRDAPSYRPEPEIATDQPVIESQLSRVMPEPVQATPEPQPQPAPQPAPPPEQRQTEPAQDRQPPQDRLHDRERDGPKPDPRRQPDVSAERKQDAPTPLGEVTDRALLRVIMRDISSRQNEGPERENRQDSVHRAWTPRMRV